MSNELRGAQKKWLSCTAVVCGWWLERLEPGKARAWSEKRKWWQIWECAKSIFDVWENGRWVIISIANQTVTKLHADGMTQTAIDSQEAHVLAHFWLFMICRIVISWATTVFLASWNRLGARGFEITTTREKKHHVKVWYWVNCPRWRMLRKPSICVLRNQTRIWMNLITFSEPGLFIWFSLTKSGHHIAPIFHLFAARMFERLIPQYGNFTVNIGGCCAHKYYIPSLTPLCNVHRCTYTCWYPWDRS